MKNTRTPRTIRTLTVAAALAVTMAACGSNDTTDEAGSDTTAAATETTAAASETTAAASETTAAAGETPTVDALTLESGFASGVSSLGTRFTSAGAVVTNTSAQRACRVKVEFAMLDAAGAVLDTKSESVPFIAAGAAVKSTTASERHPYARAIWEGYRRGRSALWLGQLDYAALLPQPLHAVRAGLGLQHRHQTLTAGPQSSHWPPHTGQDGRHGGREEDEDPSNRANQNNHTVIAMKHILIAGANYCNLRTLLYNYISYGKDQ